MMIRFVLLVCAWSMLAVAGPARADDGHDLWLRYDALAAPQRAVVQRHANAVIAPGRSDTVRAAVEELARGIGGLTGAAPARTSTATDGALLLGTPADSAAIAALHLPLQPLGSEGYLIRSAVVSGHPVTVIAANSDVGLLYGTFRFLSLARMGSSLDRLDISSAPKLMLRVLNHWDNLNRTVERGYSGQSIFDWWRLPDYKDPRYTDYARANASIGINGTVLNNVNAQPEILTAPYLLKVKALADVFRPYGIKVYLSPRFSSPIELGHLKTADPLDPQVAAWWRAKADEIYRLIPDFGGFLLKANSEGQPGPQDYHRSHAEGANVIADALAPHGGVLMYRAFVYSAENSDDRAKQAYADFKPLDGKFHRNVIVQVKNGAIDFQPREPFHPLFGAMPRTPLMAEFQITKEYLGFATHLVYLGPLFQETLESDTYAHGKGSTVARVIEGKVDPYRLTGMAGVANIGTDRDWSGSIFDQANWYAFGRFAWDPDSLAKETAEDWTRLTFTGDPRFVEPAVGMMMTSREAAVNYMTPLGLAHQMATGHHYGPGPWIHDLARPEWNPAYYNKADATGIGFDRTATGSNAVAQYFLPVARMFSDIATTPERDLLWFHHVSWDARLRSGETVWDGLVHRYDAGVASVGAMRRTWAGLSGYVDPERFAQTTTFLGVQEREAQWWRDASVAYFQSITKRPLPAGSAPPPQPLSYYEALQFPYAPGHY
jgi:alpha-glucuronidase